ncbi:hypothetical protein GCM10023340_05760 [Nocardioides marinquilinus]|uniref:PD-(D/E)XK nuclease superfamily protein n=1 Tax=Nocardioides marinquilinus TaxID=1210400 RepID=A0ABP9P885_9ACTN
MDALLTQIVASRGLPPEPVATEALVHICSRSQAAGAVMANLIAELCDGTPPEGLVFTGQDIDASSAGRPDLVASDAVGVRLILEAKFDAALTSAQVGPAYVGKLNPGVPGALVFLVPRDRMFNLWRSVSVAPGGSLEPLSMDGGSLDVGASMPLPITGHVLAVMSWEVLLNRLAQSADDHGDNQARAEVDQLRSLVEWRTSVGWTPLLPDDLPQRVGRQLATLADSLRAVCGRVSDAKIRNGTADGGFGRYIKTPSGKWLWVGLWTNWWDRYGPGPAWAQVKVTKPGETKTTSDALTAAGIAHHARSEAPDVLVPLALPVGVEQGALEGDLEVQLRALVKAVDALAVEVVEDETLADATES